LTARAVAYWFADDGEAAKDLIPFVLYKKRYSVLNLSRNLQKIMIKLLKL